jgi:hypothetical protein
MENMQLGSLTYEKRNRSGIMGLPANNRDTQTANPRRQAALYGRYA